MSKFPLENSQISLPERTFQTAPLTLLLKPETRACRALLHPHWACFQPIFIFRHIVGPRTYFTLFYWPPGLQGPTISNHPQSLSFYARALKFWGMSCLYMCNTFILKRTCCIEIICYLICSTV